MKHFLCILLTYSSPNYHVIKGKKTFFNLLQSNLWNVSQKLIELSYALVAIMTHFPLKQPQKVFTFIQTNGYSSYKLQLTLYLCSSRMMIMQTIFHYETVIFLGSYSSSVKLMLLNTLIKLHNKSFKAAQIKLKEF